MKVSMLLIFSTILMLVGNRAGAVDASLVPTKKQTASNLYLTATEAYDFLKNNAKRSLFIDVRDPMEIKLTGRPKMLDANIPLGFANAVIWNNNSQQKSMIRNPTFLEEVTQKIKEKGLTRNDPIIFLCRSGVRSAKAVNSMVSIGYTKVYSIIDGFEGDKAIYGPNTGKRTVNGWKNSNLPWSN